MLKVGDKCRTGQVVAEILGQSNRTCSFFTEDNHIRWEYYENDGQVPSEMMPAVSTFDTCLKKIKVSVPNDLARPYFEQAAKSLFSALDVGNPEKVDFYFRELASSLKAIRNAPIYYAAAGVASSFLLAALIFLTVPIGLFVSLTLYHLVSILGIAGGSLSILQRSSRLWSSPDTSKAVIVLQGGSRAFIGGLFGLFSCLLVKGDLLVGFAANSDEALFALAFLAGLSERFIPEVSANLERRMQEGGS